MNLNVLDLWFNLFPLHASYILAMNVVIFYLEDRDTNWKGKDLVIGFWVMKA